MIQNRKLLDDAPSMRGCFTLAIEYDLEVLLIQTIVARIVEYTFGNMAT